MNRHELLETADRSAKTTADRDAYLNSSEGAVHAHYHALLKSNLRLPPMPHALPDSAEFAHTIQQHARRIHMRKVVQRTVSGVTVCIAIVTLFLTQFTTIPAFEPAAFTTAPVYDIDLWQLEPQMTRSEYLVYDQTIADVQAQIALPLLVPTQLPIGYELVGAAYNSAENSADIVINERTANRVWILSQRDVDDRDELFNTMLGERRVVGYPHPPIPLSGTVSATFASYTYGRENEELLQTVEWIADGRQLRLTVYGNAFVTDKAVVDLLSLLDILP